jgi:hypothetical protein
MESPMVNSNNKYIYFVISEIQEFGEIPYIKSNTVESSLGKESSCSDFLVIDTNDVNGQQISGYCNENLKWADEISNDNVYKESTLHEKDFILEEIHNDDSVLIEVGEVSPEVLTKYDTAMYKLENKVQSELDVEDAVWSLSSVGGSTQEEEKVELDQEKKLKLLNTIISGNRKTDNLSLAF